MADGPVGSLPTPTWSYSAVHLPVRATEGNPARQARFRWKMQRRFLIWERHWIETQARILDDFVTASGLSGE